MIILAICVFLIFFAIVEDFWLAVVYTMYFIPAVIIAITIHVINPDFWPFVGAAFALAAMGCAGLLLWVTVFPAKKRDNRRKRVKRPAETLKN